MLDKFIANFLSVLVPNDLEFSTSHIKTAVIYFSDLMKMSTFLYTFMYKMLEKTKDTPCEIVIMVPKNETS